MSDFTEHGCPKTEEKGPMMLSYRDHSETVTYCHYCGQRVSHEEYIVYLEKKLKSIKDGDI